MRGVQRSPQSSCHSLQQKSWWLLLLLCASCEAFLPRQETVGKLKWPSKLNTLVVREASKKNEIENTLRVERQSESRLPKRTTENPKRTRKSAKRVTANSFRLEMFDHEILTPEEELRLGKKIRKAIKTKEAISSIVEEKHAQRFEEYVREQEYNRRINAALRLEHLSIHDNENAERFEESSLLGLDVQSLKEVKRSSQELRRVQMQATEDDQIEGSWTSLNSASDEVHVDSILLTDEDIKSKLGIVGGRDEVSRILIEGAMAREKLISSNIRLVLGIARKWCQTTNGRNSATIYNGSWTRPSLDEAIQEGIIGLATAADRFDYKRNLKFGTYATYWITNSVRNCFQRAATGCLRVPSNYYQIRQHYQKLVNEHYKASGGQPLSIESAADELGLPTKRLEFILKTTEPLISLDAPVPNGLVPTQAGKSGATRNNMNDAVLANTISW